MNCQTIVKLFAVCVIFLAITVHLTEAKALQRTNQSGNDIEKDKNRQVLLHRLRRSAEQQLTNIETQPMDTIATNTFKKKLLSLSRTKSAFDLCIDRHASGRHHRHISTSIAKLCFKEVYLNSR